MIHWEFCDSFVSSLSAESEAKRFPNFPHFGVLSDDVQRSNSIPESGEIPICE